jgi:putative ABC transport system ATP-binding protein/lipoprotein-releasing system ATP-binding protein
VIEVEDLRFSYRRGGEELFGGLTCAFPAGQVTVVTGPSGAGKSTLMYLLGLLLTPTGGAVLYDGRRASALRDRERSRLRATDVGFVFQDAALDQSRTVLDNVVEGALYRGTSRRRTEARARGLLDRFGVELRETHRPGEVSGGQAQRIGLCRALIKEPVMVLADEPTGNLDRASADVVLDALVEVARTGATVVTSSHDPAVVERGDRVVAL